MRPPPVADTLRYDTEYPTIPYSTGRRTDVVAKLAERIERGEVQLQYQAARGYLDSLLAALDIDAATQTLVFSQTSLQSRLIRPSTPRAIYFNDDVYVAYVQNAPIEIASSIQRDRVLPARAGAPPPLPRSSTWQVPRPYSLSAACRGSCSVPVTPVSPACSCRTKAGSSSRIARRSGAAGAAGTSRANMAARCTSAT
jgi:hypothetical protein